MDLKRIIIRILGVGFMGAAFAALLLSLVFILASYELDELHGKINAEYPDKIVSLLELAFPQVSQVSLQNIRDFCTIRATFNVSIPMDSIPLSQQDMDLVCTKAGGAQSMDELKKIFISSKVEAATAEVFAKVKTENVDPYSNAYLPILLVAVLAFYSLSAAVFYFGDNDVMQWLRTLAFQTFVYAGAYVLALGTAWLLLPSMVNSGITENPQIIQALAQVPAQQKPILDIFVSDAINFITNWMRGALGHFAIIYAVIGILGGAAWMGIAAAAKGAEIQEEKKKSAGARTKAQREKEPELPPL